MQVSLVMYRLVACRHFATLLFIVTNKHLTHGRPTHEPKAYIK